MGPAKKRYKMSVQVEVESIQEVDAEEMESDIESGRESPRDSGGASADAESDAEINKLKCKTKRYLKSKQRTKRLNHTIEFKLEVLDALQRGAKPKVLCEQFKIPSSTLSDWRRQENKLRALSKAGRDIKRGHRDRVSQFPLIDGAMLMWFSNQRECHPDACINTEMLIQASIQ